MGLAGDDDLDWKAAQPLGLGEQKPGALVRCKAAGKPDRQPLRVEPEALRQQALVRPVRIPERAGVDRRDALPVLLAGPTSRVDPGGFEEVAQRRRDPRRGVDAVGDVVDRDLVDGDSWPERRPTVFRRK